MNVERTRTSHLIDDHIYVSKIDGDMCLRNQMGLLSYSEAIEIIKHLSKFYTNIDPEEIDSINCHIASHHRYTVLDQEEKAKPGYVYLIRELNDNHYKIGRSANPDNRGKTFGVQLPFKVEYEALIRTEDMRRLEAELHAKFADKRVDGEWFALEPTDVEYIKSLAGGAL